MIKKQFISAIAFILLLSVSVAFITGCDSSEETPTPEPSEELSTLYWEGSLDIISDIEVLFVDLDSISKAFALTAEYDEDEDVVDLLWAEGKSRNISLDNVDYGNVRVVSDTQWSNYSLKIEGLNTYMQSKIYKDKVYVNLEHFLDMHDKEYVWDEDQSFIEIQAIPDEVVGIVNGVELSKREFDFYFVPKIRLLDTLDYTNEEFYQIDVEIKRQEALDLLIERALIREIFKEEKIEFHVRDKRDFNNRLDAVVSKNNGSSRLRQLSAEYDNTFGQMIKNFKETYLIDAYQRNLMSQMQVSDQEFDKFIREVVLNNELDPTEDYELSPADQSKFTRYLRNEMMVNAWNEMIESRKAESDIEIYYDLLD